MTSQHEWRDRALCLGRDLEAWFPDERDEAAIARAKSICAACPVQTECLAAAMEVEAMVGRNTQRHGIFGGLTERERHQLAKKKRNRTAQPKPVSPLEPITPEQAARNLQILMDPLADDAAATEWQEAAS